MSCINKNVLRHLFQEAFYIIVGRLLLVNNLPFVPINIFNHCYKISNEPTADARPANAKWVYFTALWPTQETSVSYQSSNAPKSEKKWGFEPTADARPANATRVHLTALWPTQETSVSYQHCPASRHSANTQPSRLHLTLERDQRKDTYVCHCKLSFCKCVRFCMFKELLYYLQCYLLWGPGLSSDCSTLSRVWSVAN